MIEQFQHKFTNSFLLWFDNFLTTKGQAYQEVSGELYPTTDYRVDSDYNVYTSSFKEWVYESGHGNIPTGVKDANNNTYNRGSGIVFDFNNGRALVPDTISLTSPVTTLPTGYLRKEFNVYFTNDTEEDIIVDRKYDFGVNDTGAIAPYDLAVPAAFLSVNAVDNDPFSFGGEQETTVRAKAVILAEDPFQLDGVLSIFADSQDEVFNQIPMSGHPIDENGDLKSGENYTYTGLASEHTDGHPFFVKNTQTSKLTQKAMKSLANELYVGFVDFDIQVHRHRFS